MSINSKYGLRNANDFLNTIRRKYYKQAEESHLMHNKTFIEEESLQLYENGNKQDTELLSQPQSKIKYEPQIQNFSQIKSIKPTNTFCDRLIVKNLEQTLRTYQEDLAILTENKALLEEKIDLMSEKIRKLKELQNSNKLLVHQNEESKQYLTQLIKQYHYSMHVAFRSQIHQQQLFNSLRSKIRMVLKDLGEDYYYIGFVEYWNNHAQSLSRHRKQIELKIQQEVKIENAKSKEEANRLVKIIPVNKQRKNQQDQFVAPDEPKPKKKMSQSQRASLLGDLKSFAKNFKFPSG